MSNSAGSSFKTWLGWLMSGAVLASIALFGLWQMFQPMTFLLAGGSGYMVLGRDRLLRLTVRESSLDSPDGKTSWRGYFTSDRLTIAQSVEYGYSATPVETTYEFVPSSTSPGDWNLVRTPAPGASTPVTKSFGPQGVPFLHKMNDKRVCEYFRLVARDRSASGASPFPTRSPNGSQLLNLAVALLNAHPSDLSVRVLYLDALVRNENWTLLEKTLEQWKDDFQKSANPFESHMFAFAQDQLKARKLSASGKNGYDLMASISDRSTSLPKRLELASKALAYTEHLRPLAGLVGDCKVPSFLEYQVTVKTLRAQSVFMLLQGQKKEALELLAGLYRMGQLARQDHTLIARLIAVAVRHIAASGLELYALNAAQTPQELAELDDQLDRLGSLDHPGEGLLYDSTGLMPDVALSGYDTMGGDIRTHVADTRFELVRAAVALKTCLATRGAFPQSQAEFEALLPGATCNDPFTSAPFRFLAGEKLATCYGLGPDRSDEHALIEYDPTNGSVSRGDITLKIPRERTYPFPPQGQPVRAANAEELRRQFPKGLPPDVFADTKGKPLSVANSVPVCVYSYGPDTDESEVAKQANTYVPKLCYDPTNGTVSRGDLFTVIQPR